MKYVRRVVVIVLAALGVVATATLPASAYPVGTVASAIINATVFTPGSTSTVEVKDATPGGVLTMFFESTPVQIATGPVVGQDGRGVISGQIPTDAVGGAHHIVVSSTTGESFSFSVSVISSNPGSGVRCGQLAHTGPPDPQTDRHTVRYGNSCYGPAGTVVTCTLMLGPWSASMTGTIDASEILVFQGAFTDKSHLLPFGQSSVGVVFTDAAGAVVGTDSQVILIVSNGTSTPPTVTPTIPPTAVSSSAPATAVESGAGGGGGNLASTGTQVALGAGVGLAALLAGGLVLVLSRRRKSPRHGA